jgi:hypothetical protein
MKKYQIYFFVLKAIVFAQIVFLAAGFEVAKSPIFAIVDTLFKVSLGLFLGLYFWLSPPKGLDWEDSIIISIGGFLILAEIQFGPVIALYNTRDWTISQLFSLTTPKNGNARDQPAPSPDQP